MIIITDSDKLPEINPLKLDELVKIDNGLYSCHVDWIEPWNKDTISRWKMVDNETMETVRVCWLPVLSPDSLHSKSRVSILNAREALEMLPSSIQFAFPGYQEIVDYLDGVIQSIDSGCTEWDRLGPECKRNDELDYYVNAWDKKEEDR